jgi:predicted TIM-barrel fold metal-dependent hydrolase
MIIDMHWHWQLKSTIPDYDMWLAAETELIYAMASTYGITKPTAKEIGADMTGQLDDPDGEKILKRMEENGIDAAAVLCFDMPTYTNDELVDLIKILGKIGARYPKKILPFIGVNPSREKAPEILRQAVEEFGAKGLKWHPSAHHFWPNDEKAYAIFQVAEELDIPVLTHTGHLPFPCKSKYAHPMLYADVLVDFPKLKVIASHAGYRWWPEWSAIAEWHPNFYGCLTEWQFMAVSRYEEFCRTLRQMLDIGGIDRMLWGTDSPAFDALVPINKWINIVKRLPQDSPPNINFTKEEVDAILGDNARRLLGL